MSESPNSTEQNEQLTYLNVDLGSFLEESLERIEQCYRLKSPTFLMQLRNMLSALDQMYFQRAEQMNRQGDQLMKWVTFLEDLTKDAEFTNQLLTHDGEGERNRSIYYSMFGTLVKLGEMLEKSVLRARQAAISTLK